jgi:hypothetical protein
MEPGSFVIAEMREDELEDALAKGKFEQLFAAVKEAAGYEWRYSLREKVLEAYQRVVESKRTGTSRAWLNGMWKHLVTVRVELRRANKTLADRLFPLEVALAGRLYDSIAADAESSVS